MKRTINLCREQPFFLYHSLAHPIRRHEATRIIFVHVSMTWIIHSRESFCSYVICIIRKNWIGTIGWDGWIRIGFSQFDKHNLLKVSLLFAIAFQKFGLQIWRNYSTFFSTFFLFILLLNVYTFSLLSRFTPALHPHHHYWKPSSHFFLLNTTTQE